MSTLIRNLLFLAFATVFASVGAQADDGPFQPPKVDVPAFVVSGVGAYQGRYLTVLYTTATPAPIGVNARQMNVKATYYQVTRQIQGNEVSVPGAQFGVSGGWVFNYVFVVVHDQPQWPTGDQPLVMMAISAANLPGPGVFNLLEGHTY